MDDSILLIALKWSWTVILGGFAWVGKCMYAELKAIKEDSGKCELELQKFKTHVSEHYAKDVTMQASLGRLHDRIDGIGDDIKTILLSVGHK